MAAPILIIIFHIRGFKASENVRYVLDLYVSADVHILHFDKAQINFFTSLYIALGGMY